MISKRTIKRILDDSAKFHDKLVLDYLEHLDAYKGQRNPDTENEYDRLNKKWKDYCVKKNLDEKGKAHFANSIKNVHDLLEKVDAENLDGDTLTKLESVIDSEN
jgi:hypothetical protein